MKQFTVSKLAASIIVAASCMPFTAAHAKETAVEFVGKAAAATKFEIDTSKLALQRSSNPEVKSFAQTMIDEHTAAADEMKAAMARDKVDEALLTVALDAKHAKMLEKLREAKAENFDEAYMDVQEAAHKEAIDIFEDFAGKGDTDALKIFAAETLFKLKEHAKHADTLEAKID
ncbi:MAG: DUF4142 domain-containing protein [Alphaproteobacteria bacterium]